MCIIKDWTWKVLLIGNFTLREPYKNFILVFFQINSQWSSSLCHHILHLLLWNFEIGIIGLWLIFKEKTYYFGNYNHLVYSGFTTLKVEKSYILQKCLLIFAYCYVNKAVLSFQQNFVWIYINLSIFLFINNQIKWQILSV